MLTGKRTGYLAKYELSEGQRKPLQLFVIGLLCRIPRSPEQGSNLTEQGILEKEQGTNLPIQEFGLVADRLELKRRDDSCRLNFNDRPVFDQPRDNNG